MRLRLPRSLHYPITITDLLKQPGTNVDRLEPLFSYFYKTTVTEGDPLGEHEEVEKTFPSRYESPVEGKLIAWKIKKGAVITAPDVDVADIEEPCSHSVQYAGMCTMCGKDMTMWTYNTDMSYADRATINMVHDNTALTISQDEASRLEDEAKRRLLQSRKLSLVVDLDQTIIHATVDPTVSEWQQDRGNPNHEAVKDVEAFQLVDEGPGMRGCWYYIKLRPGLKDFLDKVSQIFELHIYTMGTRAYAQNIAKIVDPDRRIFGDRILSRDESGSLTVKNLQRLFPVDTKMVVIIDDRGDVWHWSDNLVKVTPYDFFVGIGDINSSFLPKKPDLQTRPRRLRLTPPKPNNDLAEGATIREPEPDVAHPRDGTAVPHGGDAGGDAATPDDASTLDRLVSMSGGSDPATLQQQASKQDEALTAQLEDRPLLQKQKQLEAAADEAAAAAAVSVVEPANEDEEDNSDNSDMSRPHRHNLLHDDDTELRYLEQSLREVHRTFFEEYDRRLTQARGGRLAALRGDKASKKLAMPDDNADLELVPDIKSVMPQMKKSVLEGVTIVFSGVLPLGTDIQRSDIALWAKSFGAHVSDRISRRTTHLVAGRNRTSKVRQAARRGINIVTPHWLLHSISQWQWLEEEPYVIHVEPEACEPGSGGSGDGNKDDQPDTLSSDNDVDTNDEDVEARNGDNATKGTVDKGRRENEDEDMLDAEDDDDDYDPDGVRPPDLGDNPSPIEGFFTNYAWKEVDTELAEFLGSDDDEDEDEDDESDGKKSDGKESVRSVTPNPTTSLENRSSENRPSSDRKRKRARSTTPSENGVSDAPASKMASTNDARVPLRLATPSPPASASDSAPAAASASVSAPATSSNDSGAGSGTGTGASADAGTEEQPAAQADSGSERSYSRLAKRQRQARERTTGLKTVANATDVRSSLPTPEVTGAEEEEDAADGVEGREGGRGDRGEGEEGGDARGRNGGTTDTHAEDLDVDVDVDAEETSAASNPPQKEAYDPLFDEYEDTDDEFAREIEAEMDRAEIGEG